jgi:hypothetical protein
MLFRIARNLTDTNPSASWQSHRYVNVLCGSVLDQVMARLYNTTEMRTRDMLAVVGVPVVTDGTAIQEGN